MCDAPANQDSRDRLATEAGRIVPTQEHVQRIEFVRAKLAELELTESAIADAVEWARRAK
jgi:hypothetical protein